LGANIVIFGENTKKIGKYFEYRRKMYIFAAKMADNLDKNTGTRTITGTGTKTITKTVAI